MHHCPHGKRGPDKDNEPLLRLTHKVPNTANRPGPCSPPNPTPNPRSAYVDTLPAPPIICVILLHSATDDQSPSIRIDPPSNQKSSAAAWNMPRCIRVTDECDGGGKKNKIRDVNHPMIGEIVAATQA